MFEARVDFGHTFCRYPASLLYGEGMFSGLDFKARAHPVISQTRTSLRSMRATGHPKTKTRRFRSPEIAACRKTQPAQRASVSHHCGFTNRPTRPGAPLTRPLSFS